jgi:hypothetical protein
MAMSAEDAKELIESVFDFDHVGDAMMVVRKNLDSPQAQTDLINDLIRAASEEIEDNSPENRAVVESAAKERVEQFIKGSKYSQSGCSGL